MRKLFATALAFAALGLASSAPVGADPAHGVKPTCADIIGDLGAHAGPLDPIAPNTVSGGIRTLDFPTCKNFTYTVVISYAQDGVQQVRSFSKQGGDPADFAPNAQENGLNGFIKYQFTGVVSDTENVCAAYYSSTDAGNIKDASPDTAEFTPPPLPSDDPNNPGCEGWMVFGGSPGGGWPYG
jgi:hypothetical protein